LTTSSPPAVDKIQCSDVELTALKESISLDRFAAEHVSHLDKDLSLAVAEARAAADTGSWTPQMAQRFWHSFGKLCDLVKPTTVDALEATRREFKPGLTGWLLGQRANKSLAERSSTRYVVSLSLIIAVIVFLQFYVWACTTLSKRIDELSTTSKAQFISVSNVFLPLNAATAGQGHVWTPEEGRQGNLVSGDSIALDSDIDKISYETRLLAKITLQNAPKIDDLIPRLGDHDR